MTVGTVGLAFPDDFDSDFDEDFDASVSMVDADFNMLDGAVLKQSLDDNQTFHVIQGQREVGVLVIY